jgi:hypothetical protein
MGGGGGQRVRGGGGGGGGARRARKNHQIAKTRSARLEKQGCQVSFKINAASRGGRTRGVHGASCAASLTHLTLESLDGVLLFYQ